MSTSIVQVNFVRGNVTENVAEPAINMRTDVSSPPNANDIKESLKDDSSRMETTGVIAHTLSLTHTQNILCIVSS